MRIKAVLLFGLAMVILTACGGRKEDQKMASAPEFVFTYAENQAEDYPTTQGAADLLIWWKRRPEGELRFWSRRTAIWAMRRR